MSDGQEKALEALQKLVSGKDFWKELSRDVVIAVAIVLGISIFFRPTLVKESSMEPGIEDGDYLVMSRQAYRMGDVQRGDVIIFRSDLKQDNGQDKLLIKRVIGLPGDVITITNGNLWINGKRVAEEYIAGQQTVGEIHNLVVPKGQVFVLGDHREVSVDSREIGTVDQSRIKGKAVYRIGPLRRFGVI